MEPHPRTGRSQDHAGLAQQDALAGAYRRLQAFGDARPALAALRGQGHSIVVFSVGPRAWLEGLTASYRGFVDGFVSAEDAGVYKPHPGIYRHLLAQAGIEPPAALLVSSNSFDSAGAAAVGMRTAWCKRQPDALFDPWGPRPEYVITSLSELPGTLPAG